MIRALVTALLSAAAVVAGDIVFRTSLLQDLRPVILSPASQAVLEPPVQVQWDGPQRMRVLLSIVGEAPRDLGVHESPLDLDRDQFPRDGGYEIEVQALRLGNWIRATRRFQVHATPAAPAPQEDHSTHPDEIKNLLRALDAARTARDKAHGRTKFLTEENAALRDESERLAQQLEGLYRAEEDAAARVADLERRLAQLGDENRALAEENAAIRLRLGSVIPCTVWGYYSYPRPQTFPVPHRLLLVSDARGQIFRGQAECEIVRRADPTTASICFCVGNSWGG
jgi:regulator of replication initiation timing